MFAVVVAPSRVRGERLTEGWSAVVAINFFGKPRAVLTFEVCIDESNG